MSDPDLAVSVRQLPHRSQWADCYQGIARHIPTDLVGWGIGCSREDARHRAMAFLAAAVERSWPNPGEPRE